MSIKEKTNDPFNDFFGDIKQGNGALKGSMTIIIGNAGVGKTTLATGCAENNRAILINFENRISHIKETDNLRVIPRRQKEGQDIRCGYSGFMTTIELLKQKNNLGAKYLIIDTLDEAFITIRTAMLQMGLMNDKYTGADNLYTKVCESLKELKDLGLNIICTSHTLNDFNTGKIALGLTPKLRDKISAFADNIFYLHESGDDDRILQLKSSDTVDCKLSTSCIESRKAAPKELLNPTWKDIERVLLS
jgi:hypothetical protein